MPDQSPTIAADEFFGIYTNVCPNAIKPGGAQQQQNCRSQIPGQLDVRGGLQPVMFGNSTTSATTSVISIYQYPVPGGNTVCYELADGSVRVGRDVTI